MIQENNLANALREANTHPKKKKSIPNKVVVKKLD